MTYISDALVKAKGDGFLDYRTRELPTWCPGCGYFGIAHALVQVVGELGLRNGEMCVVSGIGCAGRFPIFMKVYGFHTLHGRSVPVASGVKLASPELTVFSIGGDGDILGIGGGHLPHIARKNIDITLFLFDNSIYGLTKGQSSPTTPMGNATGSHPRGNPDEPLNPVALALSHGASYVARGYAGDVSGMKEVMREAIVHKGFSLVHLVSPCVTFDKENYTWKRLSELVMPLPHTHDPSHHEAALRLAHDERIMTGIFYHDNQRPSYLEHLETKREESP